VTSPVDDAPGLAQVMMLRKLLDGSKSAMTDLLAVLTPPAEAPVAPAAAPGRFDTYA
jgi:hypothetical protein